MQKQDSRCFGFLLVVNSSSCQYHGIVISPFGGIPPPLLSVVPEMTASRVPYNPLWKTLPNCKGKIHLRTKGIGQMNTEIVSTNVNKTKYYLATNS